MMNVGMKGMGIATPLALLYHHIIVKSCSKKINNRCYPFVFRDNNPTNVLLMYCLLVIPRISLILYVFSSACIPLLCGSCRI